MKTADEEIDRLMKLLDVAIEAIRKDDFIGAELALAEATKHADELPRKPDTVQ